MKTTSKMKATLKHTTYLLNDTQRRDDQNSAPPIIRIQPLPDNCILTGKLVLNSVKNIFLWIF